jgi:CRISPR-associated exonuclease Cas4
MNEEEYLFLSDIHDFAVCPRRWALRTIESEDGENWRTIDGTNMHERVHDAKQSEKRNDIITMRALKVCSHSLCVVGECDVVEFYRDDKGVPIFGYEGKYIPFPVEYKRGVEPQNDCDKMQLCAQAICLEEMLLCHIECGALFYGEPHRRLQVEFTEELRNEVRQSVKEMFDILHLKRTPKPIKNSFCNQCSLKDICLPMLEKKQNVKDYILKNLGED